jgi:hypothetical protein
MELYRHAGVLGHDLRRQSTKLLVTLPVVLVVCEREAGLCQRLHLTCPKQPAWLGRASCFVSHHWVPATCGSLSIVIHSEQPVYRELVACKAMNINGANPSSDNCHR